MIETSQSILKRSINVLFAPNLKLKNSNSETLMQDQLMDLESTLGTKSEGDLQLLNRRLSIK